MSIKSFLKATFQLRAAVVWAALLSTSYAATAEDLALPPAGGQYDSQLGGAYIPPHGTLIVSRDRQAAPASGLYNICYVNAYQTQPAETAWWISNYPSLLLQRDGKFIEDKNWPGELLFDTSTETNRVALASVVSGWISQCATNGYDAIEADNLDSFLRSFNGLTAENNLAFARVLIAHAHSLGLAFAQKNSGDLGLLGKQAGFDFAIVEGCEVFAECQSYIDVFGPYVLEIEYTDTDVSYFNAACEARGEKISIIRRDRNLTIPGERAYFYQTC
jgi:hypothetical protein